MVATKKSKAKDKYQSKYKILLPYNIKKKWTYLLLSLPHIKLSVL